MTLEQFIESTQAIKKQKQKAKSSKKRRPHSDVATACSSSGALFDKTKPIPPETVRILHELVTGLAHLHSINIGMCRTLDRGRVRLLLTLGWRAWLFKYIVI
jgi:hypothetical protein